ncbi:TRAP transporter small permease [Marinimicrobium sp. ABcell2]|uniref:TRAP transporter small permease n=1 Tax=Marinimicrobium sp. ABcell2 TaxID=3069751 RepID=UPI0027AF74D6|nr:TRAP transporter small permease [Marinimicrobium sp. ABcell2]MDQ2076038.1 TRAP transporter small permease [Marinimicrobium sp. ABcell2]
MIDRIMAAIDKALSYFLAGLLAIMVLDVTWQVVTRFILDEPSPYTEELARFLLIWIGLLGAAYAYRKKAHLGLDLLITNLPPKGQQRADVVANLCCFAFAALVMVYGGIQLVALTLDLRQTSAALQVPMGYVYSVLPISGVLICVYALDNIRKSRGESLAEPGDKGLPVD